MANFTLQDIFGALRATIAFAAILFCPGYLLAHAVNLFAFRTRSIAERIAWAIPLSISVAAIFTILAARFVSLSAIALGFLLIAAGTATLIVLDRHTLALPRDRYTRRLTLFLAAAAALILLELVDLQLGHKLFLSVTVLDQAYRVAFTSAIAHTGIPPQNPLFHPGTSQPLRYYYFWYALCATCMRIAHVTARQAFIASSLWTLLALTAVIALFSKHFLNIRTGLRRFNLAATLLLAVTGADLLPVFGARIGGMPLEGDPEWWSADQITSWFDTILWVPNHLAALIACLMAFILLWHTKQALSHPQKVTATIIAGIAAASAFGLSIYVAIGFALLMLAWAARLLLRDRNFALVLRTTASGILAVVLLIPFLSQLLATHSGTSQNSSAQATHLLNLSVRHIIPSEGITDLAIFNSIRATHPVALDQAVRLLLLIPGYALELGIYAAVLILAFRIRKQLDEPRSTAVFLSIVGLTIVGFLRSAIISNNDFGYRAALLPSFFLLLLATDVLLRHRDSRETRTIRFQRPILRALLTLGLAGTIYQAACLRLYVPALFHANAPDFAPLPATAFAARTAYHSATIPENAILQSNPYTPNPYLYFANMLYADRPTITDFEPDCGAVFGGDAALCPSTQSAVTALFAAPAPTAAQAIAACKRLGATYLAASSLDPAWQTPQSWVWTLPLVSAPSNSFRIVNCSAPATPLP